MTPLPSQRLAGSGVLDDLSLFALVQHFCTAVGIILAKAAILRLTDPQDPLVTSLRRLPTIIAYDLLMLSAAAVLIVLAGRLPSPGPRLFRVSVALALYFSFLAWSVLSFANASFLATVGSSLNRDWLGLVPHLGTYIFSTATKDTVWIAAAGLAICLVPLALTPVLVRAGRGHTRRVSWFVTLVLFGFGLLALRQTPRNTEEAIMRNMTVAEILFSGTEETGLEAPPPTKRQTEILAGLQGGTSDEGRLAFSALSPRAYNVVLVVWESVGERYLKTHPLGTASTPNLDRLSREGSVRFRQAYAQSPLSVQTVWTLFTGRTPPARAIVFLDPEVMPPHGLTLPQVLKSQGYRTSVLIGSYSRSWGADRIVRLGGVDLFEDIETMSNPSHYAQVGWSLDGRAINDRFLTWLDERPHEEPFFSILWSVDTHFPYRWAEMSADDEASSDAIRYERAIEHADHLLGEIASGLKARGHEKDTLIIVAGDHGEGMARPPHPTQRLHGPAVLEDSIQVPLVFLQPALGKAHTVDLPVVLADVYPTLLDLLGIAWPAGLEGVSLARPISPRSITIRAMQWWPAAIRSGPDKLIMDNPRARGVLYQVEDDPLESVDISDRQAEISLALRARLLFETAQRGRTDPSVDSQWRPPWVPEGLRGPGAKSPHP